MVVLIIQSCPTLFNPMDYSLTGSSVHGIFEARILEGVAISSSRGSSQPRDQTCISCVSCIGSRFFTNCTTWEAPIYTECCVLSRFCRVRLCVTDPMDCSLLSSSVHRILQIRILKWVAIPFCRGSSRLRDQTCILCIADRFVTIRATREPLRPSRVMPSELATLFFCYKKKDNSFWECRQIILMIRSISYHCRWWLQPWN